MLREQNASNKPSRPTGSERWVTVGQAGEETEAAIVVGFLESEGIPAGTLDRSFHQTPTHTQELSEIDIAVPASRADEAGRALAQREAAFHSVEDGDTVLTGEGLVSFDAGSPEDEAASGEGHSSVIVKRMETALEDEPRRGPPPQQDPGTERVPLKVLDTPGPSKAPDSDRVHRAGAIRNSISDHPAMSVMICFGVGIVLGFLSGRRR